MSTNLDNIKDFKKYKQYKIISKEVLEATAIIHHSVVALTPFEKYVEVKNAINHLNDSKKLLEMQLKKYSKLLKEHD